MLTAPLIVEMQQVSSFSFRVCVLIGLISGIPDRLPDNFR